MGEFQRAGCRINCLFKDFKRGSKMSELKNKDRIIENLENAIDAENTMSICCGRLANLIKNGRIRKQFNLCVDTAKINIDSLKRLLQKLGVEDFVLEEKCTFCKINPESFSLLGALNLGLEIADAVIKSYKKLLELFSNPEEQDVFERLLREKNKLRAFLKQEKGFIRIDKEQFNFIDSYCIPEIVSKLYK